MHDLIVHGAGPAGLSAAIFAKQCNLDVLVVDKNPIEYEKVCGDGLTDQAIFALSKIGISTDMLRSFGANEILWSYHYHFFSQPHNVQNPIIIPHDCDSCFSLRRTQLKQLLLAHAATFNIPILFQVSSLQSIYARNILDATGCQSKFTYARASFPLGISSIVLGKSNLSQDTFYFWHHKENDNGYCWAFPLGNNSWNIGIWQQHDLNQIKANFNLFIRSLSKTHFLDFLYIRKPQGAFLGTVKCLPMISGATFSCGDAAGLCDNFSGEGISYAINSGISSIELLLSAKK